MKRKKTIFILAVVCIIIILILVFILGDKSLDLNSNEISTLYKYLGEVDIYHCGGLSTYSKDIITKDDLNEDKKLCMAYYNLNNESISSDTIKSSGVNKNDIKICKIGESITLATDEEKDDCEYLTFSKDDLNEAYKDIYGEDISKYTQFFISSSNACYLEGDMYYCGTSETFTYSLAAQATIYRLPYKAVKQLNGDIIIYDYFLKVTDDNCYLTNDSSEVSEDCIEALSKQDEIDATFVQKYGSLYKHTFKKNRDGDYYWSNSVLK